MNKKNNSLTNLQTLFNEIAQSIVSSLELAEIINVIMKQVQKFFHPKNWSLFRIDPLSQELYFVVASGLDPEKIKNVRIKLGEGIAGQVALTGKFILVKDAQKSRYFSKKIDDITGFKTHSLVAVPIMFQKQVLGVIELVNSLKEKTFNRQDVMLLQTIANFSAIAIMHALAYEKMSLLAVFDSLTGLYNRGYFEKVLETIAISNQYNNKRRDIDNKNVIVVWLDIDKFKQINDTLGHHAGDEILQKTAILLKASCRVNDLIFRMGGDEFLMLIMRLERKDISSTKKRLKNNLRNSSKQLAPASFSFGMISGPINKLPNLIKKADELMYKDKKSKKTRK